jgi:DNA-binding transcriptional MerR regulator
MTRATGEHAHLSIGEVLSLLQEEFPDVTISKIRFLESQGLIDPERTPSGYRKFYDPDVERLRFILREQKQHFLPLRVIKDRLANGGKHTDEPAKAAEPSDEPPTDAETWAPPSPSPAPAADVEPARPAAAADDLLAPSGTGVALTFEELAAACGLTPEELREVERFGLIAGKEVSHTVVYDEEALIAAKIAAGFLALGVEPRHLRSYRIAAEREAGLFEQVILPFARQRNPVARAQALDRLQTLVRLGHDLRASLLRQSLRTYTEPR